MTLHLTTDMYMARTPTTASASTSGQQGTRVQKKMINKIYFINEKPKIEK